MVKFILIVCCFTAIPVWGQSGYLGKKNSFDAKISMGPSYRMVNEINTLNRSVHRMKFASTSYQFSYSRVITRNFELSLGYQYAKIQCSVEDRFFQKNVDVIYSSSWSYYEVAQLLDEPSINYHGGVIGLQFYRLGSIAPIGKFVGFTFAFGRSVLDSTQAIILGIRNGTLTNSFFKTVSNISATDSVFVSTPAVNSWHLKARFGRNYPLTDFLMLSLEMTCPIFSSYRSGLKDQFGFQLRDVYDIDRYGDWSSYLMKSIQSYHRVSFEVALKFLL